MSKIDDSLLSVKGPDRVFYETGVLLNAEDFQAEQDYHRGRLARALSYVIGSGTVAGLKVIHKKEVPSPNDDPNQGEAERLILEPGLAIDPLGRMIEVPRSLCIRLNEWFKNQSAQDLSEGIHSANIAWPGSPAGLTLDLMLKFIPCERGKTPSFAVGPFDSLDAVTSSRIRDFHAATLIIRKEPKPPLPESPWPDLEGTQNIEERTKKLRNAIFNSWKSSEPETTSVFIARLVLSTKPKEAGDDPERDNFKTVTLNNKIRPFVLTGQALTRWLGIDMNLGEDQPE